MLKILTERKQIVAKRLQKLLNEAQLASRFISENKNSLEARIKLKNQIKELKELKRMYVGYNILLEIGTINLKALTPQQKANYDRIMSARAEVSRTPLARKNPYGTQPPKVDFGKNIDSKVFEISPSRSQKIIQILFKQPNIVSVLTSVTPENYEQDNLEISRLKDKLEDESIPFLSGPQQNTAQSESDLRVDKIKNEIVKIEQIIAPIKHAMNSLSILLAKEGQSQIIGLGLELEIMKLANVVKNKSFEPANFERLAVFYEALSQLSRINPDNTINQYIKAILLTKIKTDLSASAIKNNPDQAAKTLGEIAEFIKSFIVFFKNKNSQSIITAKEIHKAFSDIDANELEIHIKKNPILLDRLIKAANNPKLTEIPEIYKSLSKGFDPQIKSIAANVLNSLVDYPKKAT